MINFELVDDNGIVMMCPLGNALVEEIDNIISIHADNGFMMNIPKDSISKEEHTDLKDVYEFSDGSKIILELTLGQR